MTYQKVVNPKYLQKTASTTASRLYDPETEGGMFPTYFSVVLKNMDETNSVFVGSDNLVTADNGFEIKAGETVYLPCNFLEDIYIVASAAVKVCVWARFSVSAAPQRW